MGTWISNEIGGEGAALAHPALRGIRTSMYIRILTLRVLMLNYPPFTASRLKLAEREGFEPPDPCESTVFKTDHPSRPINDIYRISLYLFNIEPRFSISPHPGVKTGVKQTGSEKAFDRSHSPSSHCRWRIATQSFRMSLRPWVVM